VVNLMNLADGEIIEKLNRELQKVAQNIADKNTDFKKERKITLYPKRLQLKALPKD
jgi:hypothetical protein